MPLSNHTLLTAKYTCMCVPTTRTYNSCHLVFFGVHVVVPTHCFALSPLAWVSGESVSRGNAQETAGKQEGAVLDCSSRQATRRTRASFQLSMLVSPMSVPPCHHCRPIFPCRMPPSLTPTSPLNAPTSIQGVLPMCR